MIDDSFEHDFITLKTVGVFKFIKDLYKNTELCFLFS